METYLDRLQFTTPLRNEVISKAIRMFSLPAGSRGLDAGCGIGSHMALLAKAVGPGGHVTGLDLSSKCLARAGSTADRSGFSDRVSFRQGDVNALPFEDGSFDWAWSVDCVGQATIGEPLAGLRELVRVVRPGGRVAILGYSSQMLLPGYPLLEARLNATASAMTVRGAGQPPESHLMRALGWYRKAGLTGSTARTVVGTVQAPIDEGVRRGLVSLFGMLWGEMKSKMSDADREQYLRLTEPDSPEFILDRSDYYAFFTYSMFEGRRTG